MFLFWLYKPPLGSTRFSFPPVQATYPLDTLRRRRRNQTLKLPLECYTVNIFLTKYNIYTWHIIVFIFPQTWWITFALLRIIWCNMLHNVIPIDFNTMSSTNHWTIQSVVGSVPSQMGVVDKISLWSDWTNKIHFKNRFLFVVSPFILWRSLRLEDFRSSRYSTMGWQWGAEDNRGEF